MRFRQFLLLVVLAFLPAVFALHETEAGVVDWHKPLIGVPLTFSHSLSPTLHRFGAGRSKKSTQSVILTATEANVLAAVNPVNGSLGNLSLHICQNEVNHDDFSVWRFAFEADDPIVSFRAHGDGTPIISC